ncbi:MAG: UTP--glucose-1-phosphate uridylyltransferase [Acholeplasmataceae bacterium]
MVKKAVIPAAGWGTRFLPITKAIPKEMLPIIDKPALSYIVHEAYLAGIEEVIFIVSDNKEAIKHYFGFNKELEHFLKDKNKEEDIDLINNNHYGLKIRYVNQKEQLGLGHAVLQAEKYIKDESFAVLLGDDVFVSKDTPAIKQLINAHHETKSNILGTMYVPDENTHLYGICIPEVKTSSNLKKLKGVVEKPKGKAPSNSAIAGRYILNSSIFELLKTQSRGAGNEIQLTDAILRLMDKESVYSLDIDAKRYDIGSKNGYLKAIIDFSLEREDLKNHTLKLIKDIKK